MHISRKKRVGELLRKRTYIERYLPHVVIGLQEILGFSDKDATKLTKKLKDILGEPPSLSKADEEFMDKNLEEGEAVAAEEVLVGKEEAEETEEIKPDRQIKTRKRESA
jgi:hypothetical protein